MALGEIFAKGLVVIKGDTAHARAEIAKLSAAEQKAARDRVKAQEESNKALERSQQRFALYAAGAAAGFAIVSSSVKKYEEHLKSLGASGEGELKKLQGATSHLTKAQDNLQFAIAKLAIQAAPAAKALGDMAGALADIVGGIARVVEKAKQLPGAGSVGWALDNAWRVSPQGQLITVGQAAGDWLGGGGTDSLLRGDAASFNAGMNRLAGSDGVPGSEYVSTNQARQNRTELEMIQARVDSTIRKAEGAGRRARRRGRGGGGPAIDPYAEASASIFGDIEATSGNTSGRYSQQDLDAVFGRQANVDAPNPWTSVAPPQSLLDDLDALMGEQRESMLEQIFGPVSEFELYQTAWQGLETVVSAGFEAWISGSKGVGAAMKEALHGFAKNLAGEALMQALRHTAYGIGSLAIGGPLAGASAGKHFAAAAAWGGVAAAAATVGKVTAPSASAGGGRSNSYAAAGIGGGSGGGNPSNANLTVVMGDGFADDSPRYKARRVRRAINQARGYYPESGATEQG